VGSCFRDAGYRTSLTLHTIALHSGSIQSAYSQIERTPVRPRPAQLPPLVHLLRYVLDNLSALAGYSLDDVVLTVHHRSRGEHYKRSRLFSVTTAAH
jgi:hypothetical protein